MYDTIDERMAWWKAVLEYEDDQMDDFLDQELTSLLEAIQAKL